MSFIPEQTFTIFVYTTKRKPTWIEWVNGLFTSSSKIYNRYQLESIDISSKSFDGVLMAVSHSFGLPKKALIRIRRGTKENPIYITRIEDFELNVLYEVEYA